MADAAAGWAAADGTHSRWWLRTRHDGRPRSRKPAGAGGPRGVNVFGWGCPSPTAVASDNTRLWVACQARVLEFDSSTGAFVTELEGANYGLSDADAIASDGLHVWVSDGNSVTEIDAATGTLVRVMKVPGGGQVADDDSSYPARHHLRRHPYLGGRQRPRDRRKLGHRAQRRYRQASQDPAGAS